MKAHETVTRCGGRNEAGRAAVVFLAVLVMVLLTGAGAYTLSVAVGAHFGQVGGDEDPPSGPDVADPFDMTRRPVTYDAYTYSPAVPRPTADKAQSKLWFADGTWWGLLVNPSDDLVHVYELTQTQLWRDTGTIVDARVGSRGDALWDETTQRLVVASRAKQSPVLVTRFDYEPEDRSWTLDDGFPQSIPTRGGGPESVSVAQDSAGRLWLTYTEAGTVRVAHSDPGGLSWTGGFTPAGADTQIGADDVSAVVAFEADGSGRGTDSIGVFWSDQESDAFRFAIHRDGSADSAWQVETALAGPDIADDHLNVKTVRGRDGDLVVAAVKTAKDEADGPDATLLGVLVRNPPEEDGGAGHWSLVPAGTVEENHSRPMIVVDAENRELLLFATTRPAGGDVYVKRTSLSRLRFPEGLGQPFLVHETRVQDVTGTKQPLDSRTGVVALAHSTGQHSYVHASAALTRAGAGR